MKSRDHDQTQSGHHVHGSDRDVMLTNQSTCHAHLNGIGLSKILNGRVTGEFEWCTLCIVNLMQLICISQLHGIWHLKGSKALRGTRICQWVIRMLNFSMGFLWQKLNGVPIEIHTDLFL